MKYLVVVLVALIAAFWYWQNDTFKAESIETTVDALPPGFDGVRILLLSDLHGKMFGKENTRLVRRALALAPDAVFFAGDLVDERKGSLRYAVEALAAMAKKCPVFLTTGNHDLRCEKWNYAQDTLGSAGVHVLRDKMTIWRRGRDVVAVIGVEGGAHTGAWPADMSLSWLEGLQRPACTLALCHYPLYFAAGGPSSPEVLGAHVVFSGHNHGGQWRVPGYGGLYSPDTGFRRAYDAGMYEESGAKLIISRGLGNSAFPLRINNRPQLLMVTLRRGGENDA